MTQRLSAQHLNMICGGMRGPDHRGSDAGAAAFQSADRCLRCCCSCCCRIYAVQCLPAVFFGAVATTLKYALSFEKAKAFPKLTGDRRAFPPWTGESAVRQPSDPPWSVHSLATPTPPNASWRASCKHKIQFHSSSQPLRAALTSWWRASRSVVRRKMGPLLAGNCWSGLA